MGIEPQFYRSVYLISARISRSTSTRRSFSQLSSFSRHFFWTLSRSATGLRCLRTLSFAVYSSFRARFQLGKFIYWLVSISPKSWDDSKISSRASILAWSIPAAFSRKLFGCSCDCLHIQGILTWSLSLLRVGEWLSGIMHRIYMSIVRLLSTHG